MYRFRTCFHFIIIYIVGVLVASRILGVGFVVMILTNVDPLKQHIFPTQARYIYTYIIIAQKTVDLPQYIIKQLCSDRSQSRDAKGLILKINGGRKISDPDTESCNHQLHHLVFHMCVPNLPRVINMLM